MPPTMLLDSLHSVRRRVRMLGVAYGIGIVLAAAVGLLLATVLIDYLLNLPGTPRIAFMVLALAGTIYALVRWVVQPMMSRLTLNDVAGRLEQAFPQFNDRLRSTVDFVQSDVPGSAMMKDRVVTETTALAGRLDLRRAVVATPAYMSLTAGIGAILLAVALALMGQNYASVAFSRLMHPFDRNDWPKRVEIEMAGEMPKRVPVGQRLDIKMKLARGDSSSRRAVIRYQYDNGPEQRELMVRGADGTYGASLDSRVESGKDASNLKIWIQAGDDEVHLTPITVVPRLAIRSVEAELKPPAYVAAEKTTTVNLVAAPALVADGSQVTLNVTFNKPLKADVPVEIIPASPEIPKPDALWKSTASTSAAGSWMARKTLRFHIRATDTDGFNNNGLEEFEVIVRPDQSPSVQIENPRRNEERTAASTVPLIGVAEDDYGLQWVKLVVERVGDKKTWSIPLVEKNQAAESVSLTRAEGVLDRLRFRAGYQWDLSKLADANLKPGDVLEYYLLARDNFDLDGQTHPEVASGRLRITIITPEDLVAKVIDDLRQLKNQIQGVRNAQERTRQQTQELANDTRQRPELDAADRAALQRLLNQQATNAAQTMQIAGRIGELRERLNQNGIPAQELADLTRDVTNDLEQAAQNPMREATRQLSTANPNTPQQRNQANAAQQPNTADRVQQPGENPQQQNQNNQQASGATSRPSQVGRSNNPTTQAGGALARSGNNQQQNPGQQPNGSQQQQQQGENQQQNAQGNQQPGENQQQADAQQRDGSNQQQNPNGQQQQQGGNPQQANSQQRNPSDQQRSGSQQQGNNQEQANAQQRDGNQQQPQGNNSQQQSGNQQASAQQRSGQQQNGQQGSQQQQQQQGGNQQQANSQQQNGQQGSQQQSGGQQQQQQRSGQQQASGQQQSGQQGGQQQQQQPGDQQQQNQQQNAAADPQQREQALARAMENQQQANQQLDRALDRMAAIGSIQQQIQRLRDILSQQQRISQQTRQIGRENVGRTPEQMNQQDRERLNQAADEQQQLSQETQRALEEMQRMAQQTERSDQSSSQAMQRAARMGQQQQTSQNQQRAADQARQNQQGQAQNSQRQAEMGLEMMLNELREAERHRLAELQKRLEELSAQIELLIRRQAGHNLDNITLQGQEKIAAMDVNVIADLMSKAERQANEQPPAPQLNQLSGGQEQTERNTRDLGKTAEATPSGAEPAAHLTRAAGKMERAIIALRASKLPDAFDPAQIEALAELELARQNVSEQQEQVDEQIEEQQREGLRQRYVKIREEQLKINEETQKIDKTRTPDGGLNRPELLRLGQMPGEQGAIADKTNQITEDLAGVGSTVYVWANKDIVESMNDVKNDLGKQTTGVPTQAEQLRVLEQLDAMIKNLQTRPRNSRFAQQGNGEENQQEGGQGGQGGPNQNRIRLPAEAELRLLQDLQRAVNKSTKTIDEQPEKDKPKLASLGGRQSELRGLLDELLQKASRGQLKLGPEPDNKDQLPEEANAEQVEAQELDQALLQGNPDQDRTEKQANLIGDRMARSKQRLATNNDPGKVTQLIQQRILEDFDAMIQQAQQQQAQTQNSQQRRQQRQQQRQQRQQQQQMAQARQNQGQPQNQGQQNQQEQQGNQSAAQSRTPGERQVQTDTSAEIKESAAEWGQVTPRLRDAVMEGAGENIMEDYRKIIEEYFRSVADKGAGQ